MIGTIRTKWREKRLARNCRKVTTALPDHLLRDIGLERDRPGTDVMREIARFNG